MKKLFALMLALILCLSAFAGCTDGEGDTTTAPVGDEGISAEQALKNATAYVKNMYNGYLKANETASDFELVSSVKVAGNDYTVTWTSDNEVAKVVPGEGKVTVDVDDKSATAVDYTLTAVVSAADGTKGEPLTFKLKVPASNFVSIPDALALEDGKFVTVSGTVKLINTPWDDGYKNITVTIEDEAGNQLYIYRLATKVEIGDVVTVKGEMATYNGSRQIAAGATAEITGHVEVKNEYPEYSIPDALKLDDNTLLTVKGTVVSIDTPWNDGYKNISVTIADDAGNKLYVYRLATNVNLGDVLTIKGIMGSYNGAKQIAQGATAEITGHTEIKQDYKEVTIPEALAAEDGVLVIVKGTVVEINTEWSDSYGNITVTIQDAAGNKLYVYRLSTKVELGDILTIKGKVGSYNGAKQIAQGATAEITGKDTTIGGGSATTNPPVDTPTLDGAVVYDFSKCEKGEQYAKNELHVLDDILKVTTNDAHMNTQIRLYHSAVNEYNPNGRHATAVFESTKVITGLSVNAGNKADTLKVSASVDGTNWVVIAEVAVTEAYADYSVNIDAAAGYKFIKLEPTEKQIRVASISVVYAK